MACAYIACIWKQLSAYIACIWKLLSAAQELYSAVPVALAPVLGNPILLAAFGVDRNAPLQDQVPTPVLSMSIEVLSALMSAVPGRISILKHMY